MVFEVFNLTSPSSEPLKCGVAEDEVVEDDDPHPEEAILEHSSEEES